LLLAASGVVLVTAAACGGGKTVATTVSTTAPATTAPVADPGRDAIAAFVTAARAGRAQAMWRMLSTSSRERLGPMLADFRDGAAADLTEGVGSYRRFHTIVSERVTPELGVVAIDGLRNVAGAQERGIYAAVLRLEGTSWKIELGGPVRIRAIGPDPGAHERVVAQVAAAVQGPPGNGTAVMYVDGQTVSPTVAGTASDSTLYANFEPGLDKGRHTVVVFASAGREASAVAWAFTVAG
jgi:hypothetical protein